MTVLEYRNILAEKGWEFTPQEIMNIFYSIPFGISVEEYLKLHLSDLKKNKEKIFTGD